MTQAQRYIELVTQEINWLNQLNDLLAEEKEALGGRQFERLEQLAEQKQSLSTMLEQSAQSRTTLIGQESNSLSHFLESLSGKEADQIYLLNTRLREELNTCRELNTVNGQVIATNLYARQELINVLTGNSADLNSTYDASGTMNKGSDKGRHTEA